MLELLLANIPLVLLIAGLCLMALEAISPGAHFVVVGVALVGAGMVGLLFPPAAAPLVLAVITMVIGGAAAYVYREFDFYGGKGTPQTKDSSSLAGSTGYVTEQVTQRSGEVKLDKGGFAPYYSARTTSGTIDEGEEIIVLDPGGGNVVTVESLNAIEADEIDRALARAAATDSTDDDTEDASASNTATETTSDRPPKDELANESEPEGVDSSSDGSSQTNHETERN